MLDLFDVLTIFFALLILFAIAGGIIGICCKCLMAKRHRINPPPEGTPGGGGESGGDKRGWGEEGNGGQGPGVEKWPNMVISRGSRAEEQIRREGPRGEMAEGGTVATHQNTAQQLQQQQGCVNVESVAGVLLVRSSIPNNDQHDNILRISPHNQHHIHYSSAEQQQLQQTQEPESSASEGTVDHEMEGGSRGRYSSPESTGSSASTSIFRNGEEKQKKERRRGRRGSGGVEDGVGMEQRQDEKGTELARTKEFESSVLLDEQQQRIPEETEEAGRIGKNAGGEEHRTGAKEKNKRKDRMDEWRNGGAEKEEGGEEAGKDEDEKQEEGEQKSGQNEQKLSGAAQIEQELIGVSGQELPEDKCAEMEKQEELKKAIGPPEPTLE